MNIPSLKVTFSTEERNWILENINKVLCSGQISQGEYVKQLEEEVKNYVGAKYAIAVNSGSSAIELVMRALDVKGKDVIVPTNTFLATAMGVHNAGGNVVLADVKPDTLNIGLEQIEEVITENTAGVIIVHIGGIITPEIEKIKDFCDKRGIWLFEDAAHAIGCNYSEKYAGTFGIAGSYSLFATKVITSGEGGIIVTNSVELNEKLRILRNHGKEKDWETYHTEISSNYRMSEITAVVGMAQFKRLDEKIAKRNEIAQYYFSEFKKIPEIKVLFPENKCNWYKIIVMLPDNVDAIELKKKMKEKGIGLQGEVYRIPLHKQPIANRLNFTGDYKNADRICRQHICFPIYEELTIEQAENIVFNFIKILKSMCSGLNKEIRRNF